MRSFPSWLGEFDSLYPLHSPFSPSRNTLWFSILYWWHCASTGNHPGRRQTGTMYKTRKTEHTKDVEQKLPSEPVQVILS